MLICCKFHYENSNSRALCVCKHNRWNYFTWSSWWPSEEEREETNRTNKNKLRNGWFRSTFHFSFHSELSSWFVESIQTKKKKSIKVCVHKVCTRTQCMRACVHSFSYTHIVQFLFPMDFVFFMQCCKCTTGARIKRILRYTYYLVEKGGEIDRERAAWFQSFEFKLRWMLES